MQKCGSNAFSQSFIRSGQVWNRTSCRVAIRMLWEGHGTLRLACLTLDSGGWVATMTVAMETGSGVPEGDREGQMPQLLGLRGRATMPTHLTSLIWNGRAALACLSLEGQSFFRIPEKKSICHPIRRCSTISRG